MYREIYIIDGDNELVMMLREKFKSEKIYRFKNINPCNLDIALRSIPDLIILNEQSIETDILELCDKIRKNEDNSITPVIVISSNNNEEHKITMMKKQIEYIIPNTASEEYIFYAIKNITRLLSVNRTVSPLTGLPGNVQIQTELKKRLFKKEPFKILYLDLDNFKAYNDVYGFLKGDQIIQFTADMILNSVHTYFAEGAFVGHIGGDDFIAIVPYEENIDELCQTMLATFDKGVKRFFSEIDQERGYIEAENRKGIIEQFQLTSVSVGVVVAEKGRFANILEIGEVSTQVKHLAKSIPGSSYAIDRRKN